MDARLMKTYAAAATGLALAGTWLGIASDVIPTSNPAPVEAAVAAPAPAPSAASDAVARQNLALARAYRAAAAQVRGATRREAAAIAAAPPQVVTITRAAPVASTRSS